METKQYENEDRIITYYVGGNKSSNEVLLFLNGLYVGNKSWIKQQRYSYFNKNYKMIFFDYPGVGESNEKNDKEFDFDDIVISVKNILDLEKCNKCNLIGYSIGGMIGIWFIYKFPTYVEKLILLNTGISIDIYFEKMIMALISLLEDDVDLEKVFKLLYSWNHSEEYLEKLIDMEELTIKNYATYNKNKKTFIKFLNAIGNRPNLKVALKDIEVPTLIVSSDKDRIFPYSFQEELIDGIKDTEHYLQNNCGHASFIEKYKEINELIEKHLKKQV